MIYVMIRISGYDFPVDDFVGRSELKTHGIFHKGESRRHGKVYDKSGFSLSFPDYATWTQALPEVVAHLHSAFGLYQELKLVGAELLLDIGITVGGEDAFAPSLLFENDFLQELVTIGMNLKVSTYPEGDDNA